MLARDRSSLRRAAPAGTGTAWWILLPLALSLFVWRNLVNVYFNSDDFLNLYLIVNRDPIEYLLRPHGGHVLIVRNAVFWLMFHLFGTWPEFYQAIVLLTHLLNVALLFLLIWRLTRNGVVSAIAAAMWGTSPVHAGTIGWYSVYGQVIVAAILLAMLNHAVRVMNGESALPWRTVWTWPVLLLIASTSFGIGIGVTLVAPVVLFFLLPPSPQRWVTCAVLVVLALSTPALYKQALALQEWYSGPSSEGLASAITFQQRGFSLHQATMLAYLLGAGLSTYLSNFFATINAFPTGCWILCGAFLLLGSLTFVAGDARTRRALLACGALAVGCYGIIAQGRSQFFHTETFAAGAAQARYHYTPMIPFAVMFGLVAGDLLDRLQLRGGVQIMLLLAGLAVGAWAYRRSAPFLDLSADARQETQRVIDTIRKRAAQTRNVREVFIRNQIFRSIGMLFIFNQPGFPGWAAVYTIFFPTNEVAGKHIYFIDSDIVVKETRKGRRTADLIITEDDLLPCEYPQ